MSSMERDFEALDYGKQQKAKLTAKQYLVYSYLMSISKYDAQDREKHYYVYKNSFLIKDACELIKISQPTWRAAIKKLEDYCYIIDREKYYIISVPNTYAPLDIRLITYILPFGACIEHGGSIISVYSVLYKYWKYQKDNNKSCEITVNQLKNLFITSRHKNDLLTYKLMLGVFSLLNLIQLETVERVYKGNPYQAYLIKNVRLDLPKELISEENAPSNIDEILEAILNSIE